MGEIVENFAKDWTEGVPLPQKILKNEAIEEFEDVLYNKNLKEIAKFYKNLPEKVKMHEIEDISIKIDESDRDLIKNSDKKIIKFFTDNKSSKMPRRYFDLFGTLIHISHTVEQLRNNMEKIPESVQVSTLLWIYVTVYETILDILTKEVKNYYQNSPKDYSKKVSEIKNRTKKGNHLMANNLEKELKELKVINEENNSILSRSESRFLRNKISHANLFYDHKKGKLILKNGDDYSPRELRKEFKRIYQFLLEWVSYSFNNLNNLKREVERKVEEIGEDVSKELLKIRKDRRKANKFRRIISKREKKE